MTKLDLGASIARTPIPHTAVNSPARRERRHATLLRRTARFALFVVAVANGGIAAADWPDPDGDGFIEHRCDDTVGYCPAETRALACHADGNRPQYRNGARCLTDDGTPAGSGETCTCDHPDGCYSDCAPSPPCDAAREEQRCGLPSVAIRHEGGTFEHEAVRFSLTRTGSVHDTLRVALSVSESGDMLDPSCKGRNTVTFQEDNATTTFSPAIRNDSVDEPHSTVRVAVADEPGYRVAVPGEALAEVRDDDGLLVELMIDPLARTVDEDGTAVFDLVATTVDDGTFRSGADLVRIFDRDSFVVAWRTRESRSAEPASDFQPLSEEVTVPLDRFEAEDDRFAARWTLPGIAIFDDEVEEGDETFDVLLERSAGLDARIGIVADAATALVTIRGRQNGDLRLVDGEASYEGRLEIFHDNQWGTVCDDRWTDDNAAVACRQLGYAGSAADHGRFLEGYFPSGTGPIWLDDVFCEGDETRLTDCAHVGIGFHNCSHEEDVGVRCLRAPGTSTTASRFDTGAWLAAQNSSSTSLDAAHRGASNLDALASFSRLRRLDLSGNSLSDLSGLAAHRTLAWLDLSHNGVADIGPLADLSALRYLRLSGNRVADISPLAALRRLEVLFLDGNKVVDLEPLRYLSGLRYVVLVRNQVTSIRPLANLAALERLDLYGNPIDDLAPLGDQRNLAWLRLPSDADPAALSDSRPRKLRTLLVGNTLLLRDD